MAITKRLCGEFLLPSLLLVAASCSPVLYRPTQQNIPVLSKKGDFFPSLSTASLQVAYAPTPRIGVFATGFYRFKFQPTFISGDDNHSSPSIDRKCFDVAIGTFKAYDRVNLAIYGGYGWGYSAISFRVQGGFDEGAYSHFSKFFVQPQIILGRRAVKHAFSCRLESIRFYNFESLSYSTRERPSATLFDPAYTMIVDQREVRLKFQIQGTNLMSTANEVETTYYDLFTNSAKLSVTMEFYVGRQWKHRAR